MKNPLIFVHGLGEARYKDRTVPIVEDPYGVIIPINCIGVCGSDLSLLTLPKTP